MAQSILERTDMSALVIRALRAETPEGRRQRRTPTRPKKGAGNA
jgi:hypothetical protein